MLYLGSIVITDLNFHREIKGRVSGRKRGILKMERSPERNTRQEESAETEDMERGAVRIRDTDQEKGRYKKTGNVDMERNNLEINWTEHYSYYNK